MFTQAYKSKEVGSTADKALFVEAPHLAGIYAGAAMGMFRLMREPDLPSSWSESMYASASGIDAEATLVSWLEELLYLSEEEVEQPNNLAEVAIHAASEFDVGATVRFSDNAKPSGSQIKAATFHDLKVEDRGEDAEWRYVVTVTFDV